MEFVYCRCLWRTNAKHVLYYKSDWLRLKPCVVINKVDKENCTPEEVHEKFWLNVWISAEEEWQLDFPTVYGSAKMLDVGSLGKRNW
jgi:predicted membrane GTPase involved in stress response